jgi:hypothetical protein
MRGRTSTINIEWNNTTLKVVYTYSGYGYDNWHGFDGIDDIVILGVFWNDANLVSYLTNEEYEEIRNAVTKKLTNKTFF